METGKLRNIGAISELHVAMFLMDMGLQVFKALSPCCEFDLVVNSRHEMVTIEVRTAKRQANGDVRFAQNHNGADMFAARLPGEHEIHWEGLTEKGKRFLLQNHLMDSFRYRIRGPEKPRQQITCGSEVV